MKDELIYQFGVGLLALLIVWRLGSSPAPLASPAPDKIQLSRYPITIMLGGDVNMGRQIGKKILAGDVDYPFANIAQTLQSPDITFVNLESQLADLGGETQSPTNEYRFAGPPEGASTLANAGIDIVSVANNHMWDYGQDRLFETLDNLERAGVKYTGASKLGDMDRFKPAIIEVRGVRIAFLAMTTLLNGYEKSGATKYVSFNDPQAISQEIFKIRQDHLADFIIVSVHTGTEYKTTPNTSDVALDKRLISAGADVVVGHHPHVPQPIEIFENKPIFYSLGNFAFWQPFSFETQHSYLAKLTLDKDSVAGSKSVDYEIIPINSGWQPTVATDQDVIDRINILVNQ